jgi:hypothetical protein
MAGQGSQLWPEADDACGRRRDVSEVKRPGEGIRTPPCAGTGGVWEAGSTAALDSPERSDELSGSGRNLPRCGTGFV